MINYRYVNMRNDKHIAIKLRLEGKSYKEIEHDLGIPRSTLADWFSDQEWSKDIKQKLISSMSNKLSVAQKRRWELWREEAREEARQNFQSLRNNPLFIAGLMLYWGEGDSKIENSQVRIANTDPRMLRLFLNFLLDIGNADFPRIRSVMHLYPDLNEDLCRQYWSDSMGIPQKQFIKTQYIVGKHPTKRLGYGVCQIIYGSRKLKEKIYIWIDRFQQDYSIPKIP